MQSPLLHVVVLVIVVVVLEKVVTPHVFFLTSFDRRLFFMNISRKVIVYDTVGDHFRMVVVIVVVIDV